MSDLDQALAVLRADGVIGLPTETVYGLAGRMDSPAAVAAIFRIKGRPADHPLIVHLAHADALADVAHVDARAERLAAAFWPGPLTLLLPRTARVPDTVTGGRDTVAVRVPAHPVAHAVLARLGEPLVAPSANRFGRVSPTSAEHVRSDLGADVPLVLDGGPSEVGLESTIVDLTGPHATILRPGAIGADALAEVLGEPVAARAEGPSRAPGMLASHYAPRAKVVLVPSGEAVARAEAVTREGLRALPLVVGAGLLGGDVASAARGLYGALRAADAEGTEVVFAELPEGSAMADAIADRLRRAAHPTPNEAPTVSTQPAQALAAMQPTPNATPRA